MKKTGTLERLIRNKGRAHGFRAPARWIFHLTESNDRNLPFISCNFFVAPVKGSQKYSYKLPHPRSFVDNTRDGFAPGAFKNTRPRSLVYN